MTRSSWPVVLAAAFALAACAEEPTDVPVPEQAGEAPVLSVVGEGAAIPDRYIVVLKEDAPPGLAKKLSAGGTLHYTYEHAIRGFAATLPSAALQGIRNNPFVEFIEQDQEVFAVGSQSNATWGLDRIDQRDRPLNGVYNWTPTGSGVRAYIVDTGIRTSHGEFGGRASAGFDAFGGNGQDCNGHGTHVAGTVGGSTYGVAKNVQLVAVRVLNCSGSGTNSGVIAGVDWVRANHVKPAVANMSLGGGASTALDNAVANAVAAGVTFVVAAGNSGANACNYSPARTASAITVGSTTSSDARSSFSNYGSCLDIFAPGSSITSAWYTSNTATNTISGTSMASPHVAGAAALYLSANPGASPSAVTNAIVGTATTGRLSGIGSGSPNRLLYSLLSGGDDGGDGGDGGAPCTGCEAYSGSLSGSGDYDYHPNGNYFQSGSGTHRAWLQGPSGTDFDVYLWKWNGWTWVTVAQGTSSSSTESVTYTGTSGYYVWRVESWSGSGGYQFWMDRP